MPRRSACRAQRWLGRPQEFLYLSGVLLFEVRASETPELPQWFHPVAFCGVAGSLAGAIIGRRSGRFKPPPDRSIIGWHLIAEVFMLPARATLLVWDHLNARIVLSRAEREEPGDSCAQYRK
ncbi:MAG TPA: hypothetical protein VIT00_00835 [Terrimicrobiaceae bacterium]